MWPGQQQNQDGSRYPHQQPGPYGQQSAPWNAPTQPAVFPVTPPGGRGGRTTVVAVVAAAAVVVASAVTGFLVLGGDGDDTAEPPAPTGSVSSPAASGDARTGEGPQPTVPGWKAVLNPKTGIVFDVPPEWGLKSRDWASYVSEDDDPEDRPLVGFAAPAVLKERWCRSDEELDGHTEDTALAWAGSRTERGARTPEDAATNNASLWVYGAYAQPDRAKVSEGAARPFTTASGIRGSVATAVSSGVERDGKCDTDGKATAFAFRSPDGDIVSWTFLGAKGVGEEVPEETVRRILATVRLAGG